VGELAAVSIRDLGELEGLLDRAVDAIAEYQKDKKSNLAAVGVARISLGIASKAFREHKYISSQRSFEKYEQFLRPEPNRIRK
jgi:hypothetical protein